MCNRWVARSRELATRLAYWSTATKAHPYGWRSEDGRKPQADAGDPVRDAVTAAFAERLPESVRVALELHRHQLPELDTMLDKQAVRLFERLLDLPRPELASDADDPGQRAAP